MAYSPSYLATFPGRPGFLPVYSSVEARLQGVHCVSALSGSVRVSLRVACLLCMQASILYRSYRNEAAYELYTQALTVQSRVLDAHKTLQGLGHAPVSSSAVSVVENTAKLSFNKVRTALRFLLDSTSHSAASA